MELDERDEVEFRVVCNNYRREGRALEVRLISKAPERRELGKVKPCQCPFRHTCYWCSVLQLELSAVVVALVTEHIALVNLIYGLVAL